LTSLPPGDAENGAGRVLDDRLFQRGPPPFSLCEARLDPSEYEWLRGWIASIGPKRLDDASGHAALAFVAFIAEWNRRHAHAGTVFRGLEACFAPPARKVLFSHEDPTPATRQLIEKAARRFKLRHAFDDPDEACRWYGTIQLQYGFSLGQLRHSLRDWLRGRPGSKAMRRLLEPDGVYRSKSFQRLLADLKSFWRDYLTEADLRRTLQASPWVLPEWVDPIIDLVRSEEPPPPPPAVEEDVAVLSRPRIEWDPDRGPRAICRVESLEPILPALGRYHLWHEGRLLASWFRQAVGSYTADRAEIELPLDRPEAVVRVEDAAGNCVLVQTVPLWDPAVEVEVLPEGRAAEPVGRLEPGRAYLLRMPRRHRVSDAGAEWCLVGRGDEVCRWVLIDEPSRGLEVCDARGNVAWEADFVPSLPKWADRVLIVHRPREDYLDLDAEVAFTLTLPPEVEVDYVACNGEALEFADAARTVTRPLRLRPELAAMGFPLRVGLRRRGQLAVLRRTVPVPNRGLAEFLSRWHPFDPGDPLTVSRAASGVFRVFTNGPAALLEGNVYHRRTDGRPRPLGRLLGTGAALRLANDAYNTIDQFAVAARVTDTGILRSFEECPDGAGRYRLELARPVTPTARHQLVLWSNGGALERFDRDQIEVHNDGRVWSFSRPAPAPGESLLCAIAYEGYRLGGGLQGELSRFFQPEPPEQPGLSVRQRLALSRWFRLPGLAADWPHKKRPLMRRLAEQFPADLLAVALFDEGLTGLLGDIPLYQDEAANDRELFDVITREVLFDLVPSAEQGVAVRGLFDARHPGNADAELVFQLFSYHPLLAARVLLAAWFPAAAGQPKLGRRFLSYCRLGFAGLPQTATPTEYEYRRRRDDLLEKARRTLSEGTRQINDNLIEEGMVRPALRAVKDGAAYRDHERNNLLVAYGSAAFRHYLGLRLLEQLETRL
jgi:hypothetical protein